MTPTTPTTPTTPHDTDGQAHGLGPTRARVLALLQDAGEPMSAQDVGSRLAMHANSARFHLDALAVDGLVARDHEPRTTPGRPRVRYAASAASPRVAHRRYQLLAATLAELLQAQLPDPAVVAEQAGREWGRAMPGSERGGRRGSGHRASATAAGSTGSAEGAALEELVGRLDDVGFGSHVVDDEHSLRVEISQCPFLEVAAEHAQVVCAIHLGLMRGVLESTDAPLAVRDLEPLVEPSLCLAHLSRSVRPPAGHT